MRKFVLGAPVDLITRVESLDLISSWIKKTTDMKLIVTAYSEFYVQAVKDSVFMNVLKSADLVTPDGVSVLAAIIFLENYRGKPIITRLFGGLKIAGKIISGNVGETVTGVWLFENLTKMAANKGWKVFLLGGWNNVSGQAAKMLLNRFPKIKVEFDEGETMVGTDEKKNKEVLTKINKFAPDILFVAYNPVKQEKWLAKHKDVLKTKIGMGIGGTFDEYVGRVKKAPIWMERAGLKWLWRLLTEPKRIERIVRAVLIFPWLIFKSSN